MPAVTSGYGVAHALYIPLSLPCIFYAWSFIWPRWQLTEQYTEGLHRSVPARGAVLYTGQSRMMKEPTWGVKAAYGRVTPHLGSFYSLYRHISRFRKI